MNEKIRDAAEKASDNVANSAYGIIKKAILAEVELYKETLKAYIRHIGKCECSDFLDDTFKSDFKPEQWEILKEINAEVTRDIDQEVEEEKEVEGEQDP